MHKIVVVLTLAFAVLGSASPAMARPGISDGGPTDQARYARCLESAAVREQPPTRPEDAAATACPPKPENPRIPLIQTFEVPAGLAGTAIISCDGHHQFTDHDTVYPFRAGDPGIAGATGIVTGGPFPYNVSAEFTGRVGGYNDAYYWRINNATGAPATLVMSISCQKPAGF